MATLEKIRSKSVLLVVIIAVALLAFILGDAITNGRNLFGNNTTIAKIGKEKIDAQEYQRYRSERQGLYENGQRGDNPAIAQMALNDLILEKLADKAVDDLGIRTTPELLRFFMIENPSALEVPEMQSFLVALMQQLNVPIQSPAEAYEIISQPTKYGLTERQVEPLMRAWVGLEGKYAEQINRALYYQLLGESFKANDLDIAAARKYATNARDVKIASKPIDDASLAKYKAGNDELQKAYDENKERYKLPEVTKEISFIAVPVNPSTKDVEECKALANKVEKALKANQTIRESGVMVQNVTVVPSLVEDASLRLFLEKGEVGSVSKISDVKGFTIARLNSMTTDVNAVTVGAIEMKDDKALIDKVIAYTQSEESLDSINSKFGQSGVIYQSQEGEFYGVKQNFPKYLGLDKAKFEELLENPGQFFEVDKGQGRVQYWSIIKKEEPQQIADYELATYELHPSEATIEQARANLQKFLDKNNTAAEFNKNAKAAKYNLEELSVTSSTPAIPNFAGGYYPDSRSVVHWAMINGKDGEVSKIYQSKDVNNPVLYAAAVDGTYKDYLPLESRTVKQDLTKKVQRQKAADAFAKQYAKGTVEESAKAMGNEVSEIKGYTANQQSIADAKVRGRIMGTKAKGKTQTVKGNDAVYVFVVTDATEKVAAPDDEQLKMEVVNYYRGNINEILIGNKKFENNIFKFEGEE